ncbi:MAG: cytochrome c [Bacteroidetes bacterium]|nr:cytochrome c [Bacteroidota bacterium]
MKKILKILKWVGIALLILIAGIFIFVQAGSKKKFDAPFPDIAASSDSAMIARGEYLVYGPSHCATCHVPMDKIMAVENGERIPLTGGWEESFPGFGTFRAPNITPDPTTGIGNQSDGEIARAIRHLVTSDGRMIFPFMNYQEMTEKT